MATSSIFCSRLECGRKALRRGFCATHYERFKRGDDMDAPIKPKAKALAVACVIPACDRKPIAHDLCNVHYEEQRRRTLQVAGVTCSVDGCEEPPRAKGLCGRHYDRLKRGKPIEAVWDPNAPRGPYRKAGTRTTFDERRAARSEPRPNCACGCGEPTEFDTGRNRWRTYADVGHYRAHAPYKNETWLREQYETLGRPADDIAAECAVNAATVRRFLRKFNIPVRSQADSLRLSGKSKGNNNPAWSGGTTPERQRLYKTREWKDLVKAVYERDGYRCVRCGHHQDHGDHALHAHHIAPWSVAPERRMDMDNLTTLCRKCHSWVHSRQNADSLYLELPARDTESGPP